MTPIHHWTHAVATPHPVFMIPVGNLLGVHHDFVTPSYGPDDARWIGNWWILFPTTSVLVSCLSVIIVWMTWKERYQRTRACNNNKNKDNHYINGENKHESSVLKKEYVRVLSAFKQVFRFDLGLMRGCVADGIRN